MSHDSIPAADGRLRFRKMHGLGNDFVIVDARALPADPITPDLARLLGDRHRGIGFDQIAVLRAGEAGRVRVTFRNPDGSEAAACGNATRCIARMLMRESGRERVEIETGRGILVAEAAEGGLVRVNMGAPVEDWRAIPLAAPVEADRLDLGLAAVPPGTASAIGMGNPHCVILVPDAEAADLAALGPVIERHPLFPERTNVEFVSVLDRETVRMRVWERGLGITLACGSGACAAAVVTARRGLTGRRVDVRLDGGILGIDWRADGVWMTGPVSDVFEGVLDPAHLDPDRAESVS
jgi:diaminopimelate epimerase